MFAICKNMDRPKGIILSEKSQREKDEYCIYHHSHMRTKNKMNITKRNRFTDRKNKPVVTSGKKKEERQYGRRGLRSRNCYVQDKLQGHRGQRKGNSQ